MHVHLVTSVREREAAAAFMSSLRAVAKRYGFGERVGWDPHRGPDRSGRRGVGAYLAKMARYMAKEAAGEQTGLREILEALPGRRIYRASIRLTAETRATMRNLRLRRWAHRYFNGGVVQTGLDLDLTNLRFVEDLWRQHREHLDRQQAETTAVVRAELAFCRPPPPWRDEARLACAWWTTTAPLSPSPPTD
jgi:hypothetical protein